MAQAGFTPIQLYRTTTASAQPSAGNLAAGELAINLTDKKLYAKDASNNVFLLADASSGGTTAANLAGGAAGSLPYQSGANATTFLGIGAANRVLTSSGTAPQWVTSLTGLTGVSSSGFTNTSLTPTRLVYSTTGGAQTDSANLTFDGTSLTLGGNPTLSAGTANGVLYLNGSKVATSGSALTFDGTKLSNSGTSGGVRLEVVSTTGSPEVSITSADTGSSQINFGGATTPKKGRMVYSDNSDLFYWSLNNGFEQMRLTSTGLGIGTSSPGQKLTVQGGVNVTSSATLPAAQGSMLFSYESAVNRCYMGDGTGYSFAFSKRAASVTTDLMTLTDTGNLGIGTSSPAAKLDVADSSFFPSIAFKRIGTGIWYVGGDNAGGTNNFRIALNTSQFVTIDSSGNLGLGVAPSAWNSSFRAIQLGGGASFWNGGAGVASTFVGNNYFLNASGNRVYIANGTAAEYAQLTTGAHVWYTAPSGTAGNAISFTQAMTLDASGNLGVGTSSPGVRLQVGGGTGLQQVSVSGGGYDLALGASGGAFFGFASQAISLVFNTAAVPLGIGTNAAQPLIFGTNVSERARIPAAGGMVVGTAALATSATDGFLYVPTCAGTPTGTPTTQTGTAPIVVDTTNNKLYFYSGGQWRDAGP